MAKENTHQHGGCDPSRGGSGQHEGHEMHEEHETHASHSGMEHGHNKGASHEGHKGGDHHAHMVADYRKRFWVSFGATVPILALSPMIQAILGFKQALSFSGDAYVLWVLSSFVFF